ncbi:MAG: hypothetical protein ABSG11_17845 [Candidatus Korobacteraceae bacterium]
MSATASQLRLSGWRGLVLFATIGGAGAAFLSIRFGFATTTHLVDSFPSGLYLGLNVFCGIALAAGALTIASMASVMGGPEWRAVGRACLLAGALSYVVAILGKVANDAAPRWQVWFQAWKARSLLSGAGWTIIVLALLLFVEFLPQYSVRIARARWFAVLNRFDLPLLIVATVLAAVHQFGLSSLIRLSETKFSPLWTGPSLPSLFYLSSVVFGLAILLFASWRSLLAFRKTLPARLQPILARLLTAAVFIYLCLRILDLVKRGLFWSMFTGSREGLLMVLEVALLLCGMLWIRGSGTQPRELFVGSALIILGVIANRLNTAITALETGMRQNHLPHWSEFLIAYSLIAAGVVGFALAVEHLAVFVDLEA